MLTRAILLALVATLLIRWALRRFAGWPPRRALTGAVVASYALTAGLILIADPADLPGDGGRALAAAIWGVVHLLAFLVLLPFLGRDGSRAERR